MTVLCTTTNNQERENGESSENQQRARHQRPRFCSLRKNRRNENQHNPALEKGNLQAVEPLKEAPISLAYTRQEALC